MATRIAVASSAWSSASTWNSVATVAGAELDSELNGVNISTSNSDTGTFVLNQLRNVSAIAFKVSALTTPTGTWTAIIRNSTTSTDIKTITINCADLRPDTSGWVVFAFTAFTPNATDTYLLRTIRSVVDSISNRIRLFASTASAANLSRMVRLVETGVPAAGEKWLVAGERTGAGTSNSWTVTMDNIANTSFGPTVSGGPPQGGGIGDLGTLTWENLGSKNYYLRHKGVLAVWPGGTLNIGSSATPLDSTSTAVIEFDSVTTIDSGLSCRPGSSVNIYGATKYTNHTITGASNATPIEITSTSHGLVAGQRITVSGVLGNTAANGNWEVRASTGANTFTIGAINGGVGGGVGTSTGNGAYTSGGVWASIGYTRMTADKAAAATVITVYSTAGWSNGDELCFPSTSRTASQCEKKTILTVDSATQVTLTAGLTNAHSGTFPTQCEVGNLTRNVKIRGISSSLNGYVYVQSTASFIARYAEFSWLGGVTSAKRGIESDVTSGIFNIQYCSVREGTTNSRGIYIGATVTSGSIIISNNVLFNYYNEGIVLVSDNNTGTGTVSGNLLVRATGGSTPSLCVMATGWNVTDNSVIGSAGIGISLEFGGAMSTFSGNTSHTNNGANIAISNRVTGGIISNSTSWRSANQGLTLDGGVSGILIDTMTLFGNSPTNIDFFSAANITFRNIVSSGDTTFATTNGIMITGVDAIADMLFESCTFGVTAGITTSHTNDINWTTGVYGTFTFRACTCVSSLEPANRTSMAVGSYVAHERPQAGAGGHITYKPAGTLLSDGNEYRTTSPSVLMLPSSATAKLTTRGKRGGYPVQAINGQARTISMYIKKSSTGEGDPNYTGNEPRLMLAGNSALGIPVDTVLDTASVAPGGTWELLSGVTPVPVADSIFEIFVDCDLGGGGTGWIWVDDLAAS